MPVDPEVQKAFDRRRWLSQMYPLLPKDVLLGGFLWAAVYSDGTCFIRHPKGTKIGEYTAEEMSGWYKLSNDGKDAYGPFDTAQDAITEQRPNQPLITVQVRCQHCRFGKIQQDSENEQPYVLCQNEDSPSWKNIEHPLSRGNKSSVYPVMEFDMGCLKGERKEE